MHVLLPLALSVPRTVVRSCVDVSPSQSCAPPLPQLHPRTILSHLHACQCQCQHRGCVRVVPLATPARAAHARLPLGWPGRTCPGGPTQTRTACLTVLHVLHVLLVPPAGQGGPQRAVGGGAARPCARCGGAGAGGCRGRRSQHRERAHTHTHARTHAACTLHPAHARMHACPTTHAHAHSLHAAHKHTNTSMPTWLHACRC